jgi:hypothetical protein
LASGVAQPLTNNAAAMATDKLVKRFFIKRILGSEVNLTLQKKKGLHPKM